MKREVGLWIDHRKAIIVTIIYPDDGIRRIQANFERYVCFSEDSSWDSPKANPSTKRYDNYLNSFYGEITAYILDAESIQIFGPGEAKHDLEKRLKHEELGRRIVGIESVEKMTESQIEAKVWQHFLSIK